MGPFRRWRGGWAILVLVGPVAHAASDFGLRVEPIVGYERVQKEQPDRHTVDRLMYGLRATAGIAVVSGELEYTHGTDSETFPSLGRNIRDTDEKVKLGLVSSYGLGGLLSLQGRAGVQASRRFHEETTGGTTVTTAQPIEYDPYAGAGLRSGLGGKFDLSAGLTVVFKDFPDMSKNEYQTTLGFSIKVP